MDKCAWCKVDTEKHHKYTADGDSKTGRCPYCGSYNDIGQKTVEINSLKEIYHGAVQIIDEIVRDIADTLDYAGVDFDDIKEAVNIPDDEPLEFTIHTSRIVKKLFLSHTTNSGGTSTENLRRRLGIDKDYETWVIGESE